MERADLRARTILVLAVAALFLWMVRSILVPITLGAIFALLLHPIHLWLGRRLGRARRISPFLITLAALVLVVLPLSAIATQAVVSINAFLTNLDGQEVGEIQNSILGRMRELADAVGIPLAEIRRTTTQAVQRAGNSIAGFLSGFLSSVPEMIIDIFLFVISLYFFLRDGSRLGPRIKLLSPFSEEQTDELFSSVLGTVRGAILGTVAVAFVQGAETLIALLIFDVPGAFLFGLIAAFLSLIPVVGTMPVTVGAVLYLFANDHFGSAIGMTIAALIIGTSDNFVRPWVQSLEGRMHPLMAMLGIFGGMAAMGMAGIFIGPIVSALVVWMIRFLAEKQRQNKQTIVPA
jgi:predicted PurR-regulated permease PerM